MPQTQGSQPFSSCFYLFEGGAPGMSRTCDLGFRKVLPVVDYPELAPFCQSFGARSSALSTLYRFDPYRPRAAEPDSVRFN